MFIVTMQSRDDNHCSNPTFLGAKETFDEASELMLQIHSEEFVRMCSLDKSTMGGGGSASAYVSTQHGVTEFFVTEIPGASIIDEKKLPAWPSANPTSKKWAVEITEQFKRIVVISDEPTAERAFEVAAALYKNGDIDPLGDRDFTGESEIEVLQEIVSKDDYDKYERYAHFNTEGEMP